MGQRRVDGGKLRERAHENAICAKRKHGCRRLALQRRKHGQMLHILAQEIDHAQRSLSRAAVRLHKERQAVDLAEFAQQGIEAATSLWLMEPLLEFQ